MRLQSFIKFMIIFNIVAVFLSVYSNIDRGSQHSIDDAKNFMTILDQPEPIEFKRFKNASLAKAILDHLDVFVPVDKSYIPNSNYKKPYMGLIKDNDYCLKHRQYFVENTEKFYEEINFYSDFSENSFVRLLLNSIGNDPHTNVGYHMSMRSMDEEFVNLKPSLNLFFANGHIQNYLETGKHYSCLTQATNDVLGRESINRKDSVAYSANRYAKKYLDRPRCFNFNSLFPQTWKLSDRMECEWFFNAFNSKKYQDLKNERKIVFIRKVGAGSHRGEGVQPVDEQEELKLRREYVNGQECGRNKRNTIVQYYIHNPLLLDGHKFDFRVYMVIASTNPVIAFYHDGFLRVSLHKYDVNSNDKGVLLTNTALSTQAFEKAREDGTFEGKTEDELRDFQMWNFTKLQDYLLENKRITQDNWLDAYLRPQFKKSMIHLIRMSQNTFLKRSQIFELFGVDFMLDDDLNLWFIECNSNPSLKPSSEEKGKFLGQMLKDHIEIQMLILKSRAKRIVQYVNNIIEKGEAKMMSPTLVFIADLDKKKANFTEIIKNRFEPEFEPNSENGFKKIIDENYSGMERYNNLISQECLE